MHPGTPLCMLALLPAALPLCCAEEELPPELDAAFARYTALPDTLLPLLQQVKNRDSAEQAAEPLRLQAVEVMKLSKELSAVKSLSPQQQQLILSKYERPMRDKWGKVYGEIFRIQSAHCFRSTAFAKSFQLLSMLLAS